MIASHAPKKLAQFYGQLNNTEVIQGMNNNHFFILIGDGFKIEFYRPSKDLPWPKIGNTSSLCFKKQTTEESLQVLCDWSADLIKLGGREITEPRVESFGAELWFEDPEGNQFLLLVTNAH